MTRLLGDSRPSPVLRLYALDRARLASSMPDTTLGVVSRVQVMGRAAERDGDARTYTGCSPTGPNTAAPAMAQFVSGRLRACARRVGEEA